MNLQKEDVKAISIYLEKNGMQSECFVGYDEENNLYLDKKDSLSTLPFGKRKFDNFINKLLSLMDNWDYVYKNPLGDEEFYFHIILETFDGYQIHFEGVDGFPFNYYEFCQLIKQYCQFDMWCGNDRFLLYQDYLKIKPLYQLMEHFQNNQIDENFSEVRKLIDESKIMLDDFEDELKKAQLAFDEITIYDIENGNEELVKAIFTYYFKKNYLAVEGTIREDEVNKLLQCCYRLLEISFFRL